MAEPYFFSGKGKNIMAISPFTEEQLIKAQEGEDDFNQIYLNLSEALGEGKEPSKMSVKQKLFKLMMEEQIPLRPLENVDAKPVVGYQKKDYAEFTRLGITIPRHLLEDSEFSAAKYENKKKVKEGTKFDVKVSKKSITLTPK